MSVFRQSVLCHGISLLPYPDLFAREGLGYLLTFDRLVDTSRGSGMVFRPLTPALETKLYLVWKRYQTFSPIAERFLEQLRNTFSSEGREAIAERK